MARRRGGNPRRRCHDIKERSMGWLHALRGGLILALFCSMSVGAAGETVPLRIAVTADPAAAALFIAAGRDDFQAEGLAPRLLYLKTDAAVAAAVAAGRAEIGLAAASAPFYGFAASHGLKIIASRSSDQTGFPLYVLLVGAQAGAALHGGPNGLVGARIGVADTAAGPYYALDSMAARFGADPGSIKVVPLKSPAALLDALAHGRIDAALLPYAAALRAGGKGQTLLRLSDFTEWQQGVVFASAETIGAHRDLIERFMRGYQRGTAEYQINFLHYDDGGDFIVGPRYAEDLSLVARAAHVPPALLAATKPYCDRRGNPDKADIERQVQFWQDRGRLDRRIAADALLDLSFIGEEAASPQNPPDKG
jgi:ABC-type nitrate/sulfonate/bicarbonate transport system substrate-binding protein